MLLYCLCLCSYKVPPKIPTSMNNSINWLNMLVVGTQVVNNFTAILLFALGIPWPTKNQTIGLSVVLLISKFLIKIK